MEPSRPSEQSARIVAAKFLGSQDFLTRRYPTGLCHYVYEVTRPDGARIVVRMGHEDTREYLKGSVFWDAELRPLSLPIPRILEVDLTARFPYTILEYLPGQDLGRLYKSLTSKTRQEISKAVATIQDRVRDLPEAQGFGYGYSYSDPRLVASWSLVLEGQLARTRQWIRDAGIVDESHVDRVEKAVRDLDGYLGDVEPRAFLHDTTTKNVLVSEAGLVGIVDIDDLCFGDRLYVLSLTNMSLMSTGDSTEYIDFWSHAWNLSSFQRRVLQTYTAIHCVGFLGEVGQSFNKETVEIEPGRVERLRRILDDLLG